MKKTPLLTRVLIVSFVANAVYLLFLLTHFLVESRIDLRNEIALNLAQEFLDARKDYYGKSTPAIVQGVNELKKNRYIDYIVWHEKWKDNWFSTDKNVEPGFQFVMDGKVHVVARKDDYQIPSAVYIGEDWGNVQLIFGSFIPYDYMQTQSHKYVIPVLFALLGNVAILLFFVMYSMRDFLKLARLVKKGGIKQAGEMLQKSTYAEAQALGLAFNQVQREMTETKDSLKKARMQILPSLLSELHEGHQLPHDFSAVMVRIDINGSTAAFSREELKSVQSYWFDQFFFRANEIVNRYGGFFHEIIGDEILFYLKVKGDDKELAAQFAVASVRDIFAMAAQIDQELWEKFQFQFKIKAALDFGRLQVSEGFRGLRVSSLPPRNILVTTGRMLDMIEDKTINQAVVTSELFAWAAPIGKKSATLSAQIPGIDDKHSYVRITGFAEMHEVQTQDELLFRHDPHLKILFQRIRDAKNHDAAQNVLSQLSRVQVLNLSPDVVEFAVDTLQIFMHEHPGWFQALASFALVLPKIIPGYQMPARADELFMQLMLHEDARVQANAIEAWGILEKDASILDQQMKSWSHPRSLGNALTIILCKNLDAKYLRLLGKMQDSSNLQTQAAACYVLEMTVKHYTRMDSHVLTNNAELNVLLDQALRLQYAEDGMLQARGKALQLSFDQAQARLKQSA